MTRHDTSLLRIKTASQRVVEVLTALAEGQSVAATAPLFSHRHATIATWLMHSGTHSAALHACFFRQLHLPHIQLDELRTRLRNRAHTLRFPERVPYTSAHYMRERGLGPVAQITRQATALHDFLARNRVAMRG